MTTKKKPETTSPRVAKIAGRISGRLAGLKKNYGITSANVAMVRDKQGSWHSIGTIGDLGALAGSDLTQASDKPKPRPGR